MKILFPSYKKSIVFSHFFNPPPINFKLLLIWSRKNRKFSPSVKIMEALDSCKTNNNTPTNLLSSEGYVFKRKFCCCCSKVNGLSGHYLKTKHYFSLRRSKLSQVNFTFAGFTVNFRKKSTLTELTNVSSSQKRHEEGWGSKILLQ